MMKITYLQLVIAILLATFSHPTTSADPDPGTLMGTMLQPGAAEEGIVYDPASGNYTVTYKVPDGLYQVVYYPRTKIAPTVETTYGPWGYGRDHVYSYRVTNGAKAQQPLTNIRVLVNKVYGSVKPPGWNGDIAPGFKNPNPTQNSDVYMAGWYSFKGIAPGDTVAGFGFESRDLPGVGTIEILGLGPITVYAEGGPGGAVRKELNKLSRNDFVPYLAPVPLIYNFIGSYFTTNGAAGTLTSLQDHFQQLLNMELIEPVFAERLTKTLSAAIDALKLSDRQSARSHLEDFRVMIDEAQHAESKATLEAPINKVAARVLRYDGNYVERKL
ncbi:MAG: hypothetical protein ACE1Z4_11905 [Gammaproteobacteria bacterium]